MDALEKLSYLLMICSIVSGIRDVWDFNLPVGHISQQFFRHEELREKCRADSSCPYKVCQFIDYM